MKSAVLACSLAVFICCASTASLAEMVRGTTTGVIDEIWDPHDTGAFSVGDAVELTFTFDLFTPSDRYDSRNFYTNQGTRLSIGEHTVETEAPSRMLILYNDLRSSDGSVYDSLLAVGHWMPGDWAHVFPNVIDTSEPITDFWFRDSGGRTLSDPTPFHLSTSEWRDGGLVATVKLDVTPVPDPGRRFAPRNVGVYASLDSLRFTRLGPSSTRPCAGIHPGFVSVGHAPVCRCFIDPALGVLGCRIRTSFFDLERRLPWPLPVAEPFEATWVVHDIAPPVAGVMLMEVLPPNIRSSNQQKEVSLFFSREKNKAADEEQFVELVADAGSIVRRGKMTFLVEVGETETFELSVSSLYRFSPLEQSKIEMAD